MKQLLKDSQVAKTKMNWSALVGISVLMSNLNLEEAILPANKALEHLPDQNITMS